jgi:hypothetical protein
MIFDVSFIEALGSHKAFAKNKRSTWSLAEAMQLRDRARAYVDSKPESNLKRI